MKQADLAYKFKQLCENSELELRKSYKLVNDNLALDSNIHEYKNSQKQNFELISNRKLKVNDYRSYIYIFFTE